MKPDADTKVRLEKFKVYNFVKVKLPHTILPEFILVFVA